MISNEVSEYWKLDYYVLSCYLCKHINFYIEVRNFILISTYRIWIGKMSNVTGVFLYVHNKKM